MSQNQDTWFEFRNFCLKAAGNPTVNLLILDIEGAEFAVLKTIPWNKVDIQVNILKGNVSKISCDRPMQRWQCLISNGNESEMEKLTEMNTFRVIKNDVFFKDTIVNPTLSTLHGGSLKITLTVPLNKKC